MSEDAVASVQAAEIQRLRAIITELEDAGERLRETVRILRADDLNVMRARVYELENQLAEMRGRAADAETERDLAFAEIAVLRGTMARPEPDDDGPVTLIEGTPNAPR
jgi:hypothetical protein